MNQNILMLKKQYDEAGRIKLSAKVKGYMGYYFNTNVLLENDEIGNVVDYSCNCFAKDKAKRMCEHCVMLLEELGCNVSREKCDANLDLDSCSVIDIDFDSDTETAPDLDILDVKIESDYSANLDIDSDEEIFDYEESGSSNDDRYEENQSDNDDDLAPVSSIEIEMGKDADDIALLWPLNNTQKVFNPNMGIIGTMGTGKTQFTKSVITQLHREDSKMGILIFDYKGDYNINHSDFIEACEAKVYLPYQLPFNPLYLPRLSSFRPLLPHHIANGFKDTISRIYHLGPKQQNVLFECIIKAYEKAGISKSDKETWSQLAPTFSDVYDIYINDYSIAKNDSLYAAMSKLQGFEIFESNSQKAKSLMDMISGVTVIDLSGYDTDIQNLIVAISLDQYYLQMHSQGASRIEGDYRQIRNFILVDEADNFMKGDFPSLKKIIKEGREFGTGMILSTQFLDHFCGDENDYSMYIFTWVVHNVSNFNRKDVEYVFKLENKSDKLQEVYESIKKLEKHHSIVKIGKEKESTIEDLAFWKLLEQEK